MNPHERHSVQKNDHNVGRAEVLDQLLHTAGPGSDHRQTLGKWDDVTVQQPANAHMEP